MKFNNPTDSQLQMFELEEDLKILNVSQILRLSGVRQKKITKESFEIRLILEANWKVQNDPNAI